MISVFKDSNQDIHFFFLKFISSFLSIKHSNINIFSFNAAGNRIAPFFRIFFTVRYFSSFSFPFFYHFSRLVPFFCIYFNVVEDLIKINFLKNISLDSIPNTFINKNYKKRLSKIK